MNARLEADFEDVQRADHEACDTAGGSTGHRIQHGAVAHAQALLTTHARRARRARGAAACDSRSWQAPASKVVGGGSAPARQARNEDLKQQQTASRLLCH